jgi:hypothetical protein
MDADDTKRLPSHNPYVGTFHHGHRLQFQLDHPTYLYRHRHNWAMPMMAHSPPKCGSLRDLLPGISPALPLCLYYKPAPEDEWVMVDRHPSSKQSQL